MKAIAVLSILILSNVAFATDSINGIADIKPCDVIGKVAVVTLKDQQMQIRTVSPLGRPRLWSLERDFTKNGDGSYENGYLRVEVSGTQISSVTIKNVPSSFNCLK